MCARGRLPAQEGVRLCLLQQCQEGEDVCFCLFCCSNSQNNKLSSQKEEPGRERAECRSTGRAQGDELCAGLVGGLCSMGRVLLTSSSTPLWLRAKTCTLWRVQGPALPSPVPWPVFLSPWSCAMLSVCLIPFRGVGLPTGNILQPAQELL